MMSWLAAFFFRRWAALAAFFAAVVGLLGVYLKGRSAGTRSARSDQHEQIIEDVAISRRVENAVDSMPDDAVTKRLREQGWTRD